MSYLITLAVFCCIYVILSVSLNIAMGFTGLLNLGHVAFFAIGAYASALLVTAGVPFIAAIIAGLSSLLVSLPSLRLKGHYFAIATFGFAEIIRAVAKNWASLTRGPLGIPGIPKPEIFGFVFNTPEKLFILYFALMLVSVFLMYKIANSPFGRVLKAIREDEIAAKALGKCTTSYKVQAVLIGAIFAGIAGSMYAHYIMFIDPSLFSLNNLMMALSMVVVGGLGSVGGSILGALVIFLLPEPLRFLQIPSAMVAVLRQIIYSLILILIVMFRPEGIIKEKGYKLRKKCLR